MDRRERRAAEDRHQPYDGEHDKTGEADQLGQIAAELIEGRARVCGRLAQERLCESGEAAPIDRSVGQPLLGGSLPNDIFAEILKLRTPN